MRSYSGDLKVVTSTQVNSVLRPDFAQSNVIDGLTAIALLAMIVGAIVGCRKHQDATRRRRIHYLNRLWQLDSSKKLS
jgi:Alphavirus glycoprotein J